MTQMHRGRQRNPATAVNDRPHAEQTWIKLTKNYPWPPPSTVYLTGHLEASALLQAQHCI